MRAQFWLTTATLIWLAPLLSIASAADPDMSRAVVVCNGKFGLCGYIDEQTRQEIIPARFERAMPFSEGLAAVQIGGRFGFIDERGEIVVEPRFDLAGNFYQGLAEILVGNRTGIINRAGDIIIPPKFRRAVPLTKEVILAVEGTWTSAYYEGYEALPGLHGGGDLQLDNSGLYHISGYWIHRPNLKVSLFAQDGRGLIWATEKDRHFGPYGLLASDGNWTVEPQYEFAGPLSEERAVVRKVAGDTVLSGAVDSTGKIVVPLQSWALYGWRNGWALVRESYQSGKQALIDKNGNLIGGRYFDKVEGWDESDVSAVLIGDRWMGLDHAGNIVPYPRNGRVYASCPTGVHAIEIDGKVEIADANGQRTSPYLFEKLLGPPTCDKPFPVRFGLKWSFVGLDGRLLFDPPPFDNLYDFEDGYAPVRQGAKWAIVDSSGHFVLAPKLDDYLERRAGLFRVTLDGRETWITASGEEQPEPPIKFTPLPGMLECGHGLKLIERAGKWGIADDDGRELIAPQYRALGCFKNGVAWAPVDDRRQWCAIGPDGALREKPPCRAVHYPFFQTHSEPEKFDQDAFENSVLWSRAFLEFSDGRRDAPPRWISAGGYSPFFIR